MFPYFLLQSLLPFKFKVFCNIYFYRKFIASYVRTYTSYVATILSSMCMEYVSLAWTPFHMSWRALLQTIIKGVWPRKCMELHVIASANESSKKVIIIWSFNCLIALEAKCHLCKGSDFIMCFMTCMLKHINATTEAFTRITWLYIWVNQRYYKRKRQRQMKTQLVCKICVSRHCV